MPPRVIFGTLAAVAAALVASAVSTAVNTVFVERHHGTERTPAMAAGLTDHRWSLAEGLAFPGVQHK